MARYNVNFELSVEDMELIEGALRRSKSELSTQRFGVQALEDASQADKPADQSGDEIRKIHDLLGRLHNQKVFYRPKAAPYISG